MLFTYKYSVQRCLFIILFLFVYFIELKAQNDLSLYEIDSLIELEHSQNGQEKIETQMRLADVFVDLSFDEALSFLEKGEKLANKYGLTQTEAEIVYKKAELYYMQNDIDLSEKYTRQALAMLSDTNIIMKMSIYRDLAYLKLYFENVDSAFFYYREAMKLAEQAKDTIEQADMLNNMAYLYSQQGEPDTALAYFYEAKSLYSIMGDTLSELQAENNIALMYYYSQCYDEAMKIYSRICPLLEEYGDLESLSSLYLNKGLLVSEIYPDSDSSYIYFNKALESAYSVGNDFVAAEALRELAELYLKKGDFEKSLENFTNSLEISQKKSNVDGELTALCGMGQVYYYRCEYLKAIEKMLMVRELEEKSSIDKCTPMVQRILILSYAKLGMFGKLEEEIGLLIEKGSSTLISNSILQAQIASMESDLERLTDIEKKYVREKYVAAGLATLLVALLIYTIISGRPKKEK